MFSRRPLIVFISLVCISMMSTALSQRFGPNRNPGPPKMHDLTGKEKQEIVASSNMVRLQVQNGQIQPFQRGNVPPLTWDEGIATFARKYLQGRIASGACPQYNQAAHNPNLCFNHAPLGENIAWNHNQSMAALVGSWAEDERKAYVSLARFPGGGSGREHIGHYTQMIWADSKKIGCAAATCPDMYGGWGALILICDYSPPGNAPGEYPYQTQNMGPKQPRRPAQC